MPPSPLLERIAARTAVVGVVGLGYVGLPLAVEFRRRGFPVIGLDIDPAKTERLNRGESYIGHIPSENLAPLVTGGGFVATTDFARAADCDAILICVPTPLTHHRDPDLTYIERTAESIAPHLKPGALVVLESTTYPGTTEEVVRPILERTGRRMGADFLLAYSPEREDPGNPNYSTSRIPKVVGGCDDAALEAAVALYEAVVVRVVPVSSARVAEAVKLTENVFRCVNIALVNELKGIYARMGIDVWEVIEAAKTKPFGFMPFYPGPGLGGHCIPIDPFYLSWKARAYDAPARFVELAGEINSAMPGLVVQAVSDALNSRGASVRGARVLVVGLAYKKDVDDVRESPSLRLIRLLREKGAIVRYHDPHVARIPAMREYPELEGEESVAWDAESLARDHDLALIATDHTCIDWRTLVERVPLIVDTRNATASVEAPPGRVWKA